MQKKKKQPRPRIHLVFRSPDVLITESSEDLDSLRLQLFKEFNPVGETERILVENLVQNNWEVKRYRRTKTSLINGKYREALAIIYNQLTRPPSNNVLDHDDDEAAAEGRVDDDLINELSDLGESVVVEQWFVDPLMRHKFLRLLENYKLDENSIEAEAIRLLSGDLECIDSILASLEHRFHRTYMLLTEKRRRQLANCPIEEPGAKRA